MNFSDEQNKNFDAELYYENEKIKYFSELKMTLEMFKIEKTLIKDILLLIKSYMGLDLQERKWIK